MKSLKDLTTFESEYYLMPKPKAFVIKAFEKLEMVKIKRLKNDILDIETMVRSLILNHLKNSLKSLFFF